MHNMTSSSPVKSRKGQLISTQTPKSEASEEICDERPKPWKSLIAMHRQQSKEH